MAGIGWKLERLLARESLGATVGAYLTGVAVTSGPWLLTTLVLVLMRVSAVRYGVEGIYRVEQVITIVYATVLVLGAPIDIVLSRYASDRVYEKRADRIAAPLRRALAATMASFVVVGGGAMALAGAPPLLAVGGTALAVVVGGQWLLLSAAGGLSSPQTVLRAFAWGAPASIIAALVLSRHTGLGAAGYLYGFGAGQVITLALLLWGVLAALPAEEDESARLGPALRTYWLLAVAAMAFQGGIWVDKLVVFANRGGAAASVYAALAALAWLSVVPTCAYLFLQVETRFYRRFRAYYHAVGRNGSLAELQRAAADLRAEARRVLVGVAGVQLSVTVVAVAAAPHIVAALGLPPDKANVLRVLAAGATLQVLSLCATLMLYYFDFRREALAAALTLLVGNGLFTYLADGRATAGVGYAAGCACSCLVALVLLRARLATLLRDTYQSQPYATED